jgi:hypothetical protein
MQLMKDSTKGTAYVCLLTEYTTEQNRTEQMKRLANISFLPVSISCVTSDF